MINLNNRPVLVLMKFTLLLFTLCISINICQAKGKLVHSIDFSTQADGDALPWLEKKGYLLELDASDIDINFKNNQLNLETKEQKIGVFAIKLAPENYLENISSIDIEWGVIRHPDGADWEHGNNRVPIALMFFFCTEKITGTPCYLTTFWDSCHQHSFARCQPRTG